jgi:hypothetical protein
VLALALGSVLLAPSLGSAGHVQPPALAKMRGVCWEAGGRVAPEALDPLRALGVDWISQTPFGWCPSLTAPKVVRNAGDDVYWGESDQGLAETAGFARSLGIKTLLKPHLWVPGGSWVGDLRMGSEEDWQRWFRSYEDFILHYARLAEREHMDGLVVGAELRCAARRTPDWRRLIQRVREVYHGPLTYCANWNEEEQVEFWGDLDFIGVQAYYPLSDAPHPSLAQIRTAWLPIVTRLEALARRTGRPVVFTEVGYKSVAGTLAAPWSWDTRGKTDFGLQRDAYRALFEAVWSRSWFGGTFIWKWHPLASRARPSPDRERDFTPQGKPSLKVMREFYTHPGRSGGRLP